MKNQNIAGFTLLEILVVVLVIGILAAVALPQYQKAVAKSKAVKLQTALASVTKAVERYHMENGTYPQSFDDLDIDLDSMTTYNDRNATCGTSLIPTSYKRGDDFEVVMYDLGIHKKHMISAHFIEGKYKCRGFVHYLSNYGDLDGLTFCGEHYYDRDCGTIGCDNGLFCKEVMGKKKRKTGSSLMTLFE